MNVAPRPALNIISLCTGGGGLDFGVEVAIPNARSIVLVEREAFAVARLVSAMESGLMAPAPVWSDVRTFDGRRWRGLVDGLIGGIPCQPHSVAGMRLGAEDERDLWADARRIIVQSGAWFVLIENVQGMFSTGGAKRVWRDLRRLGFEVEIGLFTSAEVGAPHERMRVFILAMADPDRRLAARGRIGCGETSGGWSHGEFTGSGKNVADAGLVRDAGRGGTEDIHRSQGACEIDREKRQRHGNAFGDGRENVGNADCAGLEGRHRRELREHAGEWAAGASSRALVNAARYGRREWRAEHEIQCGRDAAASDGSTMADDIRRGHDGIEADTIRRQIKRNASERSERNDLPLYPPGPSDIDAWREIIGRAPQFEPAVRRMADGMAGRLDRLRMLGNGVNPLQAAYAIRTLCSRLTRRSAVAAELVWMMEARG